MYEIIKPCYLWVFYKYLCIKGCKQKITPADKVVYLLLSVVFLLNHDEYSTFYSHLWIEKFKQLLQPYFTTFC